MSELASDLRSSRKKEPAELQITAEHILMEAYEFKDAPMKTPNYKIADLEELHEYQGRKRTEYENALRRNRFNYGQWMRYGQWEIDQHDFPRARSVFERALEVDHTNVPLWIRYIQCEIKGKNINHARNLLDRATKILPRVDKLWYQYLTIEESLGNIIAARSIFENWLQWKPGPEVWRHYIEFETRYKEFDNARLLFEKLVIVQPTSDSWILWAEFEKHHGDSLNVRNIYKLAVPSLTASNSIDSKIFLNWIQWEMTQKSWDQVKELFKVAESYLTDSERMSLNNKFTQLEKQFGNKESIEVSVLNKRRQHYEKELDENPFAYETWWIYIELLAQISSNDELRLKFDLVTSKVPTSVEKTSWLRYIYIWIKYLVWEEKVFGDTDKVRNLYQKLLKIIPHKSFTFSRIWIMAAEYEVRQNNLMGARKILGRSLGTCPNSKIIRYYIEFETNLKEFDRVRVIYCKLLENFPDNATNWIDFATLEHGLGDEPRCEAIYELGVRETLVSEPERIKLMKAYINHQLAELNFEKARTLYDQLIELSNDDLKYWISRCLLEIRIPTDEQLRNHQRKVEELGDDELELKFEISEEAKDRARDEFNDSIKQFKLLDLPENRIVMLEALKRFETKYGTESSVADVEKRLPKLVKKFRANEEDSAEEEYIEYIFLDDELEKDEEIKNFKDSFFADGEVHDESDVKSEDDVTNGLGGNGDSENEQIAKKSFKSRFEADEEDEDEDEREEEEIKANSDFSVNRKFESDSDDEKVDSLKRRFEPESEDEKSTTKRSFRNRFEAESDSD
ncbi:hypothetical protein CANARDRAFT_8101 [[Candida] arabinofermentans NRRL YB-2248]|uniref:Pre-mRNA-splicing factor CLF1 n=1 Tax=[Candida] arabinofermentans NRRL YB-2248 TaxID=983967 RepID=A0A1E4SZP5_9ASCO|nr:hypothetical protein CANARDRAFT_8101 [[Candida] arabinofermentans NRRL YB-2248]